MRGEALGGHLSMQVQVASGGLTCMPSSANMNIVSRISMTRLDMCGTARMNVVMIL